jgi:membrane-bound ClpP family serine protease
MKPSRITAALGMVLIVLGVLGIIGSLSIAGIVPLLIGASLLFLAVNRGRVATLVFGHTCIVVGAYLITWGILLLPHSEPRMAHIFGRPLFWGIFSLMGGICAIFHGFCRCVTKQVEQFEGIPQNKIATPK